MSAVALDDVRFRHATSVSDALAGITLAVEASKVTWLYGAAGSGCSTLLLVVAGLAPRFTGGTLAGRIRVLGADPQKSAGRSELRARIGFVSASPALQLSGVGSNVWEEVAFAPANLGWSIERIRSAVGGALARLGIGHLADRHPARLSGGELQRVIIASLLVLEPAVWLLDEPAAPLDSAGMALLARLLREEAGRGAAVIVAMEDAEVMLEVADRIIVLDQGAVVMSGEPGDMLAREEIWTRGPGSTPIAALGRTAGQLVADPRLAPPYPLTVQAAVARWA